MRRLTLLTLFISSITFASSAKLDPEVQFLTDTVRNSQCQFIRNGDVHSGENAVEHMLKKYDYYEDDIHSAEDFIRKAASKSTMTGKPYEVKCANSQITSQQWLLRKLQMYRQQQDL